MCVRISISQKREKEIIIVIEQPRAERWSVELFRKKSKLATLSELGVRCVLCVRIQEKEKKRAWIVQKERKKERQQHYHRVDVYNIQYQQAGSLSLESRVYVGCVMSDSMMMMMIVGGVDTMVERERVRDSQLFLARKVGKFHSSMLWKTDSCWLSLISAAVAVMMLVFGDKLRLNWMLERFQRPQSATTPICAMEFPLSRPELRSQR